MFVQTAQQTNKPFIALFGALIMVNLMMQGGENAPVYIIGRSLAGATGESWIYFASYLGALGSFFSGSNTVSNLTFGGIQQSIAQTHRPECQFNPRAPSLSAVPWGTWCV